MLLSPWLLIVCGSPMVSVGHFRCRWRAVLGWHVTDIESAESFDECEILEGDMAESVLFESEHFELQLISASSSHHLSTNHLVSNQPTQLHHPYD